MVGGTCPQHVRAGATVTALIQSALSTQFVQVQVQATVNGAPYNPTNDPVAFAFTELTTPVTPPAAGDWQPGVWETDPGPVYWAGILVGPANGGFALAQGSWTAWVKITDNPEIPVLQPLTLVIA